MDRWDPDGKPAIESIIDGLIELGHEFIDTLSGEIKPPKKTKNRRKPGPTYPPWGKKT